MRDRDIMLILFGVTLIVIAIVLSLPNKQLETHITRYPVYVTHTNPFIQPHGKLDP